MKNGNKGIRMIKLLVTSSLLLSSVAHSAAMRLDVPCGSISEVHNILAEYNEKPMLHMASKRNETANSLILFVNSETKTYTLVEKVNELVYCVISTGEELEVMNK